MRYIRWVLTPKCNYDCWFCRRHFNDIPEPSKDTIDKIIEFINKIFNEENIIEEKYLEIDGGESTLYKYFLDTLRDINFNKFQINTNLSCNLDILKKSLEIFKYKNIIDYRFVPTFHAEYADSEEFLSKIEYLIANDVSTVIRFTFEKNDYDYIMERYYPLYCKIVSRFPSIDINNLIKINAGNYINIDNRIYKYFDKCRIIKKIIKTDYYDKFTCCHRSDSGNLIIDYNGDVYQCCGILEMKKYKLFNILSPNSYKIYQISQDIEIKCLSEIYCLQ